MTQINTCAIVVLPHLTSPLHDIKIFEFYPFFGPFEILFKRDVRASRKGFDFRFIILIYN